MNPDRSSDDFASLFEASLPSDSSVQGATSAKGAESAKARTLALGQPCRAQVVQVGQGGVFVEVLEPDQAPGSAREGKPLQAYLESINLLGPDGELHVKPGDVIDAVVVAIDRSGEVRLGRSMGRPAGVDELERAHESRRAGRRQGHRREQGRPRGRCRRQHARSARFAGRARLRRGPDRPSSAARCSS